MLTVSISYHLSRGALNVRCWIAAGDYSIQRKGIYSICGSYLFFIIIKCYMRRCCMFGICFAAGVYKMFYLPGLISKHFMSDGIAILFLSTVSISSIDFFFLWPQVTPTACHGQYYSTYYLNISLLRSLQTSTWRTVLWMCVFIEQSYNAYGAGVSLHTCGLHEREVSVVSSYSSTFSRKHSFFKIKGWEKSKSSLHET